MVESELAFQLAVIELDRPAQAGEAGEPLAAFRLGQVGEPVVARRVGAGGPVDDQPLPARRQTVGADRVRRDDTYERETARDVLACRCRLARERLPGPPRQPRGERTHRLRFAV